MKSTATQEIVTGKIDVRIYENLDSMFKSGNVNTDYHGTIKRRGDTVITEDETKFLCDRVEGYTISAVDMMGLESYAEYDEISSEVAKHISDGVIAKLEGIKITDFAGQVFMEQFAFGGYGAHFIYGYALAHPDNP